MKNNIQDEYKEISVLSNVIFDPYFAPSIKLHFGETVKIHLIPYGEHNENEYKKQIAKSDLIIIWLNFEELLPDIWNFLYSCNTTEQNAIADIIGLCKKLYADISAYSNARILWFSFENCFFKLPIVSGYGNLVKADFSCV